MKKINAIIVDDEKSARDILSAILGKYADKIELLAICENVPDAAKAIKKYKPDVVFLDIEMPNFSGYEIVDFFEEVNFDIVFVTAHNDYAIKAFEISAVDYILKPIDLIRFQKTIEKLVSKMEQNITLQQLELISKSLKKEPQEKIVILDKGYKHFLDLTDLVCIEAQESYCKIYTSQGKTFLVSKKLKHYELLLSEKKNFFRTHKSWLINLTYLERFSKSQLEIKLTNRTTAKLSRYKLQAFENLVNS